MALNGLPVQRQWVVSQVLCHPVDCCHAEVVGADAWGCEGDRLIKQALAALRGTCCVGTVQTICGGGQQREVQAGPNLMKIIKTVRHEPVPQLSYV